MLIVPRQVGRSGEVAGRMTRRVAAECPSLPPIAWFGDSRRTRRGRPRRRPRRLHRAWPGRVRAARDARRWSDRATPSTATTPRRSRCSLARRSGVPPRELAAALADELGRAARDQVGGDRRAGLPEHPAGRRRRRRARPDDRRRPARSTARSDALAGQKINLEFVSANPTGPVHIGGVRWAAVGDALSPAAAGHRRRRRHRVLLQRRRLADRPVRPLAARRREGRAGAGGRLRRGVHRRDRRPRCRPTPAGRARAWTTPTPRRCSGSRASR